MKRYMTITLGYVVVRLALSLFTNVWLLVVVLFEPKSFVGRARVGSWRSKDRGRTAGLVGGKNVR